jgi:hypothetical protein
MQRNKYELRSLEVENILSNPPHLFALWGVIFIITIMFGLLCLLNSFKVHETITIPVEISNVGGIVELKLNTVISEKVRVGQSAMILLNSINPGKDKQPLTGVIDRIAFNQFNAPIIFFRNMATNRFFSPGMIGSIEITISEKTFFQLLFESFSLKNKV